MDPYDLLRGLMVMGRHKFQIRPHVPAVEHRDLDDRRRRDLDAVHGLQDCVKLLVSSPNRITSGLYTTDKDR